MKQFVQKQLAQSIATMQAILADENITDTLLSIGQIAAKAMQNGGKLLVAGSGRSAANAQYLVAEILGRPGLRAFCLAPDNSTLTAGSNEGGDDSVFAQQIQTLGQKGDVFLGISPSGDSKSIIAALEQANKLGIATVGFTGNGGGQMCSLCEYNVIVPSNISTDIQESHLVLEHIFCMVVERFTVGVDSEKHPQSLTE